MDFRTAVRTDAMNALEKQMNAFRQFYLWLIVAAFMLGAGPAEAQSERTVRVRLFDLKNPEKVRIAGQNGSVRLYAGDFEDELLLLSAGEDAVVTRAGGQLHVKAGDLGLFAQDLRIEPPPGGEVVLEVGDGSAATEPRRYEGIVRIAQDDSGSELLLVNEVGLEDYVAAVVSTEYGFDDLEGAKAMAVIIRTYTLAIMDKYGGEYDHVDHTLSQVYRGTERITPTIREAVRLTQGEVLEHEGRLIEAVYFSSSGGHTADNETVWDSRPLPYLRGRPDPYGAASPHAEWTFRVSREPLLSALSGAFGDVDGFVIGDRSDDGRVATVDLLDSSGDRRTVRSNEFRLVLLKEFGGSSLRSTMFTARRAGDEYVFEGHGYGHGVGLSQWGAHELGQRNTPYDEILNFYYTDVSLTHLDGVEPARQQQPQVVVERTVEEEPAPKIRRIGW